MLKNYLKIALRNLRRQKGYTFINVAGLTLGMACCLLIFQFVAYEYSFDDFNANGENLYRITQTTVQNGEEPGHSALTGYRLGPSMEEEVPEIVRYARIHPNYGDAVFSYAGAGQPEPKTFKELRVYYVDPAFLGMFSYSLVQGDADRALTEPSTLLLSESMARKYFGAEDPLGKIMEVTGWVDSSFTVAGVFQDVPAGSHLQFDFLLPMDDLLRAGQYRDPASGWGWNNFNTYVELRSGADLAAIEQKVWDVVMKYQREDYEESKTELTMQLQPLGNVHLNPDISAPMVRAGSYKTVYFFVLIGLITLVIALVNYVNLATARALDRSKEVGVRKVVGANQGQLMGQFLLESALTNLAALVLAIVLALALTPVVNRIAEVELTGALWLDGRFWLVFLGIFGVGALLSGLYPAFVLSSFKPVTVLKGKAGAFASRLALRKVLVVLQFAASIALLAGTAIVFSQLSHMRQMDLGLTLDQVVVVESPRIWEEGVDRLTAANTYQSELRKIPGVGEMAFSNSVPGRGFNWYSQMRKATADPSTSQDARATGIDHQFAGVYDLELMAGRYFTERSAADTSGGDRRVVINESAVKALGYTDNAEAVDQHIIMGGGEFLVVGVLKDFNWSSAHQEAEAVMFQYAPAGANLSLKVGTENLPQTIASIQRTYEALFPGNPFEYYFLDEAFDEQYQTDERFATLFGSFAGIAILIACLGLFGLAAFTAEQRTKEIGVRKVLGASVGSIVGLLSKDFLKLVLIAFVIAAPAAYYFMSQWLQDFAYRTELGPGVFLLAGVSALGIALATVSYQAVKAAVADPVKSLRYE